MLILDIGLGGQILTRNFWLCIILLELLLSVTFQLAARLSNQAVTAVARVKLEP